MQKLALFYHPNYSKAIMSLLLHIDKNHQLRVMLIRIFNQMSLFYSKNKHFCFLYLKIRSSIKSYLLDVVYL